MEPDTTTKETGIFRYVEAVAGNEKKNGQNWKHNFETT